MKIGELIREFVSVSVYCKDGDILYRDKGIVELEQAIWKEIEAKIEENSWKSVDNIKLDLKQLFGEEDLK